MQNLKRKLPPLDTLVFFEAAARHASFTAAAGELHVTQAAVSKRIRTLEERLGVALFHRRGRRLALTAEGRLLQSRVTEALKFLADSCGAVSASRRQQPIAVAAGVAVAHYWLGPRLTEYQLQEAAAPLRMLSSDRAADLLDADNDLVVHYGEGAPAGWRGHLLFDEVLVPLAAPAALVAGHRPPRLPLLEYERKAPEWVNWEAWLERTDAPALAEAPRLDLGSYIRTVDAALDGRGVALGSPLLLSAAIAAGRLVTLAGPCLATGRGYHLLVAQARPQDPVLSGLVAHLLGGHAAT